MRSRRFKHFKLLSSLGFEMPMKIDTPPKTYRPDRPLFVGSVIIPNRSLDRLPIILGFFHRFLFIFRLLVGILPALFSRRSPLRLQEQDRQYAQQYTKSAQVLTTDLG